MSTTAMQWNRLINPNRLTIKDGQFVELEHKASKRSPFQVDVDRVIFSSAFRRLQSKTQVHPLSDNDHVHTRLTHTIEVGSVGQSLGLEVADLICSQLQNKNITAADIGYLVQGACLAHDIGNPPFGHSGETAIRAYFSQPETEKLLNERLHSDDPLRSNEQLADFKTFEGNAQGLRIIAQLEMRKFEGGLQLTLGTLASFMKYPRPTQLNSRDAYIGAKKPGYFQSEALIAKSIAEACGLIPRSLETPSWCRHPLVYLVEAADDICYSVVDLEDGLELSCLSFAEVERALAPIARHPGKYQGDALQRTQELQSETWYSSKSDAEKIGFLRGKAIANLVEAAVTAFKSCEKSLLEGELNGDLLGQTVFADDCKHCKKLAVKKIYNARHILPIEFAGFQVLNGLLDYLVEGALAYDNLDKNLGTVPPHLKTLDGVLDGRLSKTKGFYAKLMRAMDYVAGMTDRYAVTFYQELSGTSL